MKKLIALLLAALMTLSCTAVLAEETAITSADGVFSVSFQLPEGVEMISGEWIDDTIYQANLKDADGLYIYLAVSAPATTEAEEGEETAPVTYNEENGYTDSYIVDMVNELFKDDSDALETGVRTTAHGTKLALVHFNDESAPSAYIFTTWQGYEIGLTLVSMDAEQKYVPVTDEQIDKVVAFLSEMWMNEKKPAE